IVVADGLQPLLVDEAVSLELAELGRGAVGADIGLDDAVGADRDAVGVLGNGDARLHLIAVDIDQQPAGVTFEGAVPRVAGPPVGQPYGEEALAAYGEVKLLVGRVRGALAHDARRG